MHARNLRNKPSETLIKCMEEAIDLQLYLVQEKGPLCLTFKDNSKKKFQISIGNQITCSCGGGKGEHCVHALFTLNKFFKIPFNHPFMLRSTFSDAELNQLIEKKNSKANPFANVDHKKEVKRKSPNNQAPTNQMSLIEDNICPICQEDMYTAEGVYYCSNGCGHNYHMHCLKIFLQHKREQDDVAKCPMCRARWDETEFNRVICSQTAKCTKRHKGVNCANCQRMAIKFERFHCLHCASYDLCSECFECDVHKDQGHKFIVKKGTDEKWYGCDYDDTGNQTYILRNIYLNQYLSDSLPNDNTLNNRHNRSSELKDGREGEEGEESKREPEKKCSVCKMARKGNSTLEFLLFKVTPCGHFIHVKCLEKVFRIISFENNNIVVDRYFNKCRHTQQTEAIYPGLESIHYKTELSEAKPNQQNDIIMWLYTQGKGKMQKPTPNMKKQLIKKLLNAPNAYQYSSDYQGDSLTSAFNIQKIDFTNNNDIQNYENLHFNSRSKAKSVKQGLSKYTKAKFKPIPSRIKKSETLVARNRQDDSLSNQGGGEGLLSIEPIRMNGKPARYEHDSKVSLSPLLVDIPFNDELI